MDRLTKVSEITDSATLVEFCESCGESGCNDFCEDHQDNNCIGCPVQEAFERLSAYEDSELSPEQVKALQQELQQLHAHAERMRQVALMISKYVNALKLDKQHFAEFICLCDEAEKAGGEK